MSRFLLGAVMALALAAAPVAACQTPYAAGCCCPQPGMDETCLRDCQEPQASRQSDQVPLPDHRVCVLASPAPVMTTGGSTPSSRMRPVVRAASTKTYLKDCALRL